MVRVYCINRTNAFALDVNATRNIHELNLLIKQAIQRHTGIFCAIRDFEIHGITGLKERSDGSVQYRGETIDMNSARLRDTSYSTYMMTKSSRLQQSIDSPDWHEEGAIPLLVFLFNSFGTLVETHCQDPAHACKKRRVELPSRRLEMRVLVEDGHEESMEVTPFPNTKEEILEFLLRRLPFRLANLSIIEYSARKIFDEDSLVVECKALQKLMDTVAGIFSYNRGRKPWKYSLIPTYHGYLRLTEMLCSERSFPLHIVQDRFLPDATEVEKQRSDCVVSSRRGVLLLRGEVDNTNSRVVPRYRQRTPTTFQWSHHLYGNMPYTLVYVTDGSMLDLFAVFKPCPSSCQAKFELLESFFVGSDQLVTVFYNMAQLFERMDIEAKRTRQLPLIPFASVVKYNKTVELISSGVRRKYTIDHSRMVSIYKTLDSIGMDVPGRRHLQEIREWHQGDRYIEVVLGPVAYRKEAFRVEEYRSWEVAMLSALSIWHEAGYCHGDVQWHNVGFVCDQTESGDNFDVGFWLLLNMDKSRPPNHTKITWDHEREGETLVYQHNLLQVGNLLLQSSHNLPSDLTDLEMKLRMSLTTGVTAKELLEGFTSNAESSGS